MTALSPCTFCQFDYRQEAEPLLINRQQCHDRTCRGDEQISCGTLCPRLALCFKRKGHDFASDDTLGLLFITQAVFAALILLFSPTQGVKEF